MAGTAHDLIDMKHCHHMQHDDCADRLTLLAQPVLQWDRSKEDMRPFYIYMCNGLMSIYDMSHDYIYTWLIYYMRLPGIEGHDKGGISQEDGKDDHDLDDVHEVVAHCEARRQGDEGVLGVYFAGTLCILLCLEVCLHSHPGCSSCRLACCM